MLPFEGYRLPIEDYLMPAEEIKLNGAGHVNYAGKLYQLIVTDKRILLDARRGMISKSDDVVSVKLEELCSGALSARYGKFSSPHAVGAWQIKYPRFQHMLRKNHRFMKEFSKGTCYSL